MKKTRTERILAFFKTDSVTKYFISISLIVVSLFISGQVQKWRDAKKDHEKLREYLTAIQSDVATELKLSQANLKDCKKDQSCLFDALKIIENKKTDSTANALNSIANVMWRGVFRTFPPTTFDVMVQNGDINLIKDLKYRTDLSAAFAFRDNVVREDFKNYDLETTRCAEILGKNLSLTALMFYDHENCLTNKKNFFAPRNELYLLMRNAELKDFHLENLIEDLKNLEKMTAEKLIELN